MYDANGHKHFYVNELAELRDGRLFIPFRWFVYRNQVYADAWSVTIDAQVRFNRSQVI